MANKTDWQFKYLGRKDNRDYFCIITEDNNGNKRELRHRYYVRKRDDSLLPIGSLFVPSFEFEPSYRDAHLLKEKVARFFYGWFPNDIQIINKDYF